MRFWRRRKPKIDPFIAGWLLAVAEERRAALPGQDEFVVPDKMHIARDGSVTFSDTQDRRAP